MAVLQVLLVLLGLCWKPPCAKGATLTLGGKSIPTSGILIIDINTTNTEALLCRSELNHEEVGIGDWYLHPTQQSIENEDRIDGMNDRGWYRNRAISDDKQVVRLMRVSATAEEGVFTCGIAGDTSTPVSVGIFYPIQSVLASIQVVEQRNGLFKVLCNSTGGRALNMTITGPEGFNSDLNNIQPVGDLLRIGGDEFSASTDVISGGRDGDIYQCTATNGVSSHPTGSAELRVASAPSIISLEQISSTAVRVEWSQPSEGATVTDYVVHYSDGDTDRTESVAASSTSSDITHLTSGFFTYTISVEATSQQLSGESDEWTTIVTPVPEGVVVSDVKSTSVRVSWQEVDNADRYTVTLSQTIGDDQLGLCPEASHTVAVNTPSLSVFVGQTEDDMLRAYTTYFITVVAESDVWGRSQQSDPVILTTMQTGALVSPRNVAATVLSSIVISVQWDGLTPCSQVNGLIVEYRVQYTAESSGVVQSIEVAGEWNVMRAHTFLIGLTPYTNYSIQVAAVNEQGDVGLYSDPTITLTLKESNKQTLSTKSSSNTVTPIIVGVAIAIIGAVIGVVGSTFGVFTAYMKRLALTKQVEDIGMTQCQKLLIQEVPARSAGDKAGVRTEDNPAYSVSAPVYEMPQLSSASPDEVVYEGVL